MAVQQYVEAPSLRERLGQGSGPRNSGAGLLGADELDRLVRGLLDVLEYLHGRAPPVVSGMPPHEFPFDNGRIEVPDDLPAEPRLTALIKALLEPAPRKRPASAAAARLIYEEPRRRPLAVPTIVPTTAIAVMAGEGPRFVELGPPPRDPRGEMADVYLDLIDPSALFRLRRNPIARALVALGASVLTLGVLPVWSWSVRRDRVRRYRRLFIDGHAVVGRIVAIVVDDLHIAASIKYGYQVDGLEYRGFMEMPRDLARYWSEGDAVTVLHDPADPSDSCFVFRRVVR